jgi:hypothetical protein
MPDKSEEELFCVFVQDCPELREWACYLSCWAMIHVTRMMVEDHELIVKCFRIIYHTIYLILLLLPILSNLPLTCRSGAWAHHSYLPSLTVWAQTNGTCSSLHAYASKPPHII